MRSLFLRFLIFAAVALLTGVAGHAQVPDATITFDNRSGQPALVKLIGPSKLLAEVPDQQRRTVVKAADVNVAASNGKTALMLASEKGHLDVVQALLDNGAEVNAKMPKGTTALMLASYNGHLDVVQTLLAKGADVNVKASDGGTALLAATMGGHLEIRAVLVQAGAKP